MFCAVISPMSGMAVSSSLVADISASSVRKWAESTLPAFCPTCRMPKANRSLERSRSLEASSAAIRFSGVLPAHPLQSGHLLHLQTVEVGRGLDELGLHQRLHHRGTQPLDVHGVPA